MRAFILSALLAAAAMYPALAASDPGANATLKLELEDFAQAPITGELDGENTRGLLARLNVLRDEPGGRRFFVNDLNGPLYILDKKTRRFTTYLDFNGLNGRPGLFPKFTFERNFATGLTNFIFDPDYRRNGTFYTLHMEDPSTPGNGLPKAGDSKEVDLSKYKLTPAIRTPTVDGKIAREVILVEWKDRDISNATFEGTAREILRVEHPLPQHPLGEMTFNPAAKRGDADWRIMYLGAGDSGSGDQKDSRHLNPQRLDTVVGKILRIIPAVNEKRKTSSLSDNGQYRIPSDNPFVSIEGARPEIWAYGLRNPHRLIWDVEPARNPRLLAFHIGLVTWETIVVIHRGANYGWPLREGNQVMTANGATAISGDDRIPIQITDTISRDTIVPTYPVLQYPHRAVDGGDAIANGYVYRGKAIPALKDKLLFGDITSGRMWYTNASDIRAAEDGDPATVATSYDIEPGLRSTVESAYRARGGKGETLPGRTQISGAGRVDLRFAEAEDGELYLLTKADGVIRKLKGVGVSEQQRMLPAANRETLPEISRAATAATRNPIPASATSSETGQKAYSAYCASCHGDRAQGAVKAGTAVSIIEESGGRQPPDLTDPQWDHGASDGEIFNAIKRGIPSTMMPAWNGALSDDEIWHIVNYLRSIRPGKTK